LFGSSVAVVGPVAPVAPVALVVPEEIGAVLSACRREHRHGDRGHEHSEHGRQPASGGIRSEQLGLLGLSLGERCAGSVAQTAETGSI
jgi:hypothetical protein